MPNRNNNFIFVPHCLLAPAFQANGIVKYDLKHITKQIVDSGVNIVQLPCSEFHSEGLNRETHGRKYYNTEKFKALTKRLAGETVSKIKEILKAGYNILAIIGIEMSPSCAVNYQYTNKGMIKEPGFFIENLMKLLDEENIKIKFIGINRRHPRKAIEEIGNCLEAMPKTSKEKEWK